LVALPVQEDWTLLNGSIPPETSGKIRIRSSHETLRKDYTGGRRESPAEDDDRLILTNHPRIINEK